MILPSPRVLARTVSVGDVDVCLTGAHGLIGTTLMSIGPALSGATLDGKSTARKEELQQEILSTLKSILEKLPAIPAPA